MENSIEKLMEYDNLYYNHGKSPISDEKYDTLKETLMGLYPDHPYFKTVGSEKNVKTKLPYVLGSLNKIKLNTIEKWINENPGPYVFSEKVDGVSILVEYNEGNVVRAFTRGNGTVGQDITEKAKIFCPSIKYEGEVVLRGDATLFDKLDFKNKRNGTAGILNRDDLKQCEYIKPIFYECIKYDSMDIESEYEEFVIIESIGLRSSKWEVVDNFNLEYLLEFYERAKNKEYDIDGVVISINKNTRENVLFPKNKIAFKLQGKGVWTTVTDVVWKVSRGGRVIPIIQMSPVEIDGSTVSKTTGFNNKFIVDNKIGKGKDVEIIKSGDVIPYIINMRGEGEVNIPFDCPSCGSFLIIKGVDLVCNNPICDGSVYKTMEYFIRTLGAENITQKTLEKLNIKSIKDLYTITNDEILRVEGFAKKKANNFISEVRKTLKVKGSILLTAFGIPGVGKILSEKLVKQLGSIEAVLNSKEMELQECEGVGEKISSNIYENSNKYMAIIEEMRNFGLEILPENEVKGVLESKIITLTGKGPIGRKELEEMITSRGGILKGVSKSTNILVTDDLNSSSSKMKKAKEYGIKIVDYEEFLGGLNV